MTVVLNHTIVRSADKNAAAQFLAGLLDLQVGEPSGPFRLSPAEWWALRTESSVLTGRW
jgi:hypothetical protein